jgi:long-chain acyl-CoA synthetase
VIDYCRERLTVYKALRMVEFRVAAPVTATGNVLNRLLGEERSAERRRPPDGNRPSWRCA